MRIDFPSKFLWGAALSSYQTEGGNYNTDWCAWERKFKLQESGHACNHRHLYVQDFTLAKSLNLNSVRISLEWARLCPARSGFCEDALNHYSQVLDSLSSLKLAPLVTLHHFTNPLWFADQGGWLDSRNIDHFLNYLQTVVRALCEKIDYWIIFNEPLVYIFNGFVRGVWPPGITSLSSATKVVKNMTSAYLIGYQEIHRIYKNVNRTPYVSISKHLRKFSPCPQGVRPLNALSANLRHMLFNQALIDYLAKKRALDFIGINYYCKEYVRFTGVLGQECLCDHHPERKNYMQWNVDPEAFYELLMQLKRFKLPVIVTENGTAEERDQDYQEYMLTHLQSVARARHAGVDITGYLWWSLIDNFEWDKGFKPCFGLAEVDYQDFSRKIRPYALTYAKICKENAITVNGLKG